MLLYNGVLSLLIMRFRQRHIDYGDTTATITQLNLVGAGGFGLRALDGRIEKACLGRAAVCSRLEMAADNGYVCVLSGYKALPTSLAQRPTDISLLNP